MKVLPAILVAFTVAVGLCNALKDDYCCNTLKAKVHDLEEKLGYLEKKLDKVIGGDKISPPEPGKKECKPINLDAINPKRPFKVITGFPGPFGAIAKGNDVYITCFNDKFVFHYNSKVGDGIKPVEPRTPFPSGAPAFIDIHDDYLYVTSVSNLVYKKPLKGGVFTAVAGLNAPYSVGIKWSKDGERLLVSEWTTGKINVFNKNMQKITSFATCSAHPREISFDSNGDIRFTTEQSRICIYNGDTYAPVASKTIDFTVTTEGYYEHCDGTLIIADRAGRLVVTDKEYKTLRFIPGYSSLLDVTLTDDGTLYVTDFGGGNIHLYKVY